LVVVFFIHALDTS